MTRYKVQKTVTFKTMIELRWALSACVPATKVRVRGVSQVRPSPRLSRTMSKLRHGAPVEGRNQKY